jgi:hypothetical protein
MNTRRHIPQDSTRQIHKLSLFSFTWLSSSNSHYFRRDTTASFKVATLNKHTVHQHRKSYERRNFMCHKRQTDSALNGCNLEVISIPVSDWTCMETSANRRDIGETYYENSASKLGTSEFHFICVNTVGVVTRWRAERSGVRIQAGARDFSLVPNVRTGSKAHTPSCSVGTRCLCWC